MSNAARKSPRRATLRNFGSLAAGSTLLVAGVGTTVALAPSAGAASFSVTNLNDSGLGSLRQAIIDTNGAAGADTIEFAPGVSGMITLQSDLPVITEALDISGPGAANLTVSGDGTWAVFAIAPINAGEAVTISGLTITDGQSATRASGISAIAATLNVESVVLTENVGGDDVLTGGGAVGTYDSIVSIFDSTIDRNTASTTGYSSQGGGISSFRGSIVISGSTITNNSADYAGGILAVGDSATITGSTISSNVAAQTSGGVLLDNDINSVSDSIIDGNRAANVGGTLVFGPATSVTNTRISNNVATEDVGGAVIYGETSTVLDRLTVTGNVGDLIGGLELSTGGTISSSTISGNTGAGIEVANSYYGVTSIDAVQSLLGPLDMNTPSIRATTGPLAISHTTVTGNSREGIVQSVRRPPAAIQPQAPAPSFPGIVSLDHVLLADNGLDDLASPVSARWSFIEKPVASVVDPSDHNITGVDPQLQPLLFVSDTVSVIPVPFGSPAWNAGDPAFSPPPEFDQRGLPRIVEIVDIGAYEVQELPAIPTVPTFAG
ncbi:unannotated protein [freshwater metagenome]|uniref:Unannotated protein n=1 Tax=freshwater metagenome TaxID=449393 RepID=A0A6J6HW15_9ZZZZ|nr:hypothetical protein [Actinomycetota bacterium]